MTKLNTTDELISAIAKGEMVILMDDEERENEGDIIMAAELQTQMLLTLWQLCPRSDLFKYRAPQAERLT